MASSEKRHTARMDRELSPDELKEMGYTEKMPSEERRCPKCGRTMELAHDVYVDVLGDIWDPDDDTANERFQCYCGHEEKVR